MEKRNYVKPYTAVMNVQTEGVIAASGGEIIIPDVPDTYISTLTPDCTKGGNVNKLNKIGDCIYFQVNYTPCSGTWNSIKPNTFQSEPYVNIEYTSDLDGVKMYKVTINPTSPCGKK